MTKHEHVLTQFHVAKRYAEVVIKCTACFRVWAGNVAEVDNPHDYYSPDEADAMRRAEPPKGERG